MSVNTTLLYALPNDNSHDAHETVKWLSSVAWVAALVLFFFRTFPTDLRIKWLCGFPGGLVAAVRKLVTEPYKFADNPFLRLWATFVSGVLVVCEMFAVLFLLSFATGAVIYYVFAQPMLVTVDKSTLALYLTDFRFIFYSFALAGIPMLLGFFASPLRIFEKSTTDANADKKMSFDGKWFFIHWFNIATGKYDHIRATANTYGPRVYAFIVGMVYVFQISGDEHNFRMRFYYAFFVGGLVFPAALALLAAVLALLYKNIMNIDVTRAKAAEIYGEFCMGTFCTTAIFMGVFVWSIQPSDPHDGEWWTRAVAGTMASDVEKAFTYVIPLCSFGFPFSRILFNVLSNMWREWWARRGGGDYGRAPSAGV